MFWFIFGIIGSAYIVALNVLGVALYNVIMKTYEVIEEEK